MAYTLHSENPLTRKDTLMEKLYAILCVPKNFSKIERALDVTKDSLYAAYRLNGPRILLMRKDSCDIYQLRYSFSREQFRRNFVWSPAMSTSIEEAVRQPPA